MSEVSATAISKQLTDRSVKWRSGRNLNCCTIKNASYVWESNFLWKIINRVNESSELFSELFQKLFLSIGWLSISGTVDIIFSVVYYIVNTEYIFLVIYIKRFTQFPTDFVTVRRLSNSDTSKVEEKVIFGQYEFHRGGGEGLKVAGLHEIRNVWKRSNVNRLLESRR